LACKGDKPVGDVKYALHCYHYDVIGLLSLCSSTIG